MMLGNRLSGDGADLFAVRPAEKGAVAGLVMCPVPVAAAQIVDLYRLAYEQARDAARTSWFERVTRDHRN
jgi:hypothetical protein